MLSGSCFEPVDVAVDGVVVSCGRPRRSVRARRTCSPCAYRAGRTSAPDLVFFDLDNEKGATAWIVYHAGAVRGGSGNRLLTPRACGPGRTPPSPGGSRTWQERDAKRGDSRGRRTHGRPAGGPQRRRRGSRSPRRSIARTTPGSATTPGRSPAGSRWASRSPPTGRTRTRSVDAVIDFSAPAGLRARSTAASTPAGRWSSARRG